MPSQSIKPKGKVFRDPVHRLIRIEPEDQFALDLINTPAFQRLRRIRQLGVSNLTYHGAEHSRFAHSLGVFNFAQRIISALQRRYGTSSEVGRHLAEHARVAKAAALLHDIGHGPFSHMIERVSGARFDHEQMTAKLILKNEHIRDTLLSHAIDPQQVSSIINHEFPSQLIVDIVSSQLDADRMDYLLRDSLMTGVEYGIYDAEWLLNAMCVGKDPAAPDSTTPSLSWRLCLDRDRGLYAAEQLILARHHMMLQVYMHRVTRGYELMLLRLFQEAASRIQNGDVPPNTPAAIHAYFSEGIGIPTDDWLSFDEASMTAAFQAWSRSSDSSWARVRQLASCYLNRERSLRGFSSRKPLDVKAYRKLQDGLSQAGLREGFEWELDSGEHLPYKGVSYGVSGGSGDEEQSALSILLSDGDPSSKGRAIEGESGVLKLLDNNAHPLARLYVDRSRVEDAMPAIAGAGLETGATT